MQNEAERGELHWMSVTVMGFHASRGPSGRAPLRGPGMTVGGARNDRGARNDSAGAAPGVPTGTYSHGGGNRSRRSELLNRVQVEILRHAAGAALRMGPTAGTPLADRTCCGSCCSRAPLDWLAATRPNKR